MSVYLSPGVFPREIDLSALPNAGSGIIPAFVGTAKKGPVNVPTLVTTSANYINTFGDPFVDSNLGYAVLSYMEEGNLCWVMRVGVECEAGQASELADICLDTSGAMVEGWGRVGLFTGIGYGKIRLRTPTTDAPMTFHDSSVTDIEYNDIDVSSTDGPTVATLTFTASDYIGSIDDTYTVLITSSPTSGVLEGAEFDILRQSDGASVTTGTLVDAGGGVSEPITVGTGDDATGLIFTVDVTGSSPIEQDDSFTFMALPDNRNFAFAVEGVAGAYYAMAAASYTDADAFVLAFNALISGEDYIATAVEDEIWIRTETAGERIQLVGTIGGTDPNTEGWALEVGTTKWVYDIPRAALVGTEGGPFVITTQNDRVFINVIGSEATANLEFSIPNSLNTPVTTLATYVHNGGISQGERYYESFALRINDDEQVLAVVTVANHEFDELKMLADWSHVDTLRFAQEVGIRYPYQDAYRSFVDVRVEEPVAGAANPLIPYSCEDDPLSSDCAEDTAYYESIVGYIVAKTPGTWIDDYLFTIENFNGIAGRYTLKVFDLNGVLVDRTDDVSFDPTELRYIANVVNAGSSIGGQNGNLFYEWLERVSTVGPDEVRIPATRNLVAFTGSANGIPEDAIYSSALDAAVIGSEALKSGLYAFDNPETIDISLLSVPGFSSGSVIGTGLQICESRGDCFFLIDPPFGLKPQQVIDWHNGMLDGSDLSTAINSSYGGLWWSWLKIFDQYSTQELFVPPAGHISAVFARTERERESWYAPAGLNRGRLLTALDVEESPSRGDRDALYGLNNAVNPIVKFPQDGIVVWGQRTLQRADTALDRINVRMLLIHIRKVLVPLLRQFLFEQNDVFLWEQVKGTVDPVLSDIAGRRGLTAFSVICDETNNTPETIDRNELHVTVLLKPTRVVEFIQLDLAILRTDAIFSSEAVLRAAGITG